MEDNTHAQFPGKSFAHVIKQKLQYVMPPNALVVPTGVFQQAESKSRIQAYKHINFKSQKYLKVRQFFVPVFRKLLQTSSNKSRFKENNVRVTTIAAFNIVCMTSRDL